MANKQRQETVTTQSADVTSCNHHNYHKREVEEVDMRFVGETEEAT